MNDIIATILGLAGLGLLIFAYIWHIRTIKNYPEMDENIPLVAFQEMRKDR